VPGKQAAREYARAIMGFAPEHGESSISLFSTVLSARTRNADFNRFLHHPAIPLEDKYAIIKKLTDTSIPGVVENILKDLLTHQGIDLLRDIIDFLIRIREENSGVQEAEVSSTADLTDEQKRRITAAIGDVTGKKPEVMFKTDAGLIAGYKVKIGDHVYDNSVQRQLELINDQLTATKLI
jgi:F-type H+-transporting ATPase subunit delta